ncbi:hypothetical protein GF385_01520 [Candidatus Dependentiae bacterium]|nr:hypothetical protein [Candidatus Dependentiae bacterium]
MKKLLTFSILAFLNSSIFAMGPNPELMDARAEIAGLKALLAKQNKATVKSNEKKAIEKPKVEEKTTTTENKTVEKNVKHSKNKKAAEDSAKKRKELLIKKNNELLEQVIEQKKTNAKKREELNKIKQQNDLLEKKLILKKIAKEAKAEVTTKRRKKELCKKLADEAAVKYNKLVKDSSFIKKAKKEEQEKLLAIKKDRAAAKELKVKEALEKLEKETRNGIFKKFEALNIEELKKAKKEKIKDRKEYKKMLKEAKKEDDKAVHQEMINQTNQEIEFLDNLINTKESFFKKHKNKFVYSIATLAVIYAGIQEGYLNFDKLPENIQGAIISYTPEFLKKAVNKLAIKPETFAIALSTLGSAKDKGFEIAGSGLNKAAEGTKFVTSKVVDFGKSLGSAKDKGFETTGSVFSKAANGAKSGLNWAKGLFSKRFSKRVNLGADLTNELIEYMHLNPAKGSKNAKELVGITGSFPAKELDGIIGSCPAKELVGITGSCPAKELVKESSKFNLFGKLNQGRKWLGENVFGPVYNSTYFPKFK